MNNNQKFKELMSVYNQSMTVLTQLLIEVSSDSIGYQIDDILDEDEANAKEFGVQFLKVSKINSDKQTRIISSLNFIRKDLGYSTQFVTRYPGLIVVRDKHEEVKQAVSRVNELKNQLAETVRFVELLEQNNQRSPLRRPRDKHQKHKFIHDLEPGIMTEQLYRNIQMIEEPVTNCWFNWTQRPVSINLKDEAAINWINSLREHPRSGFSKQQWQLRLDEISLKLNEFDFIQHYRLLRHIPICTYQTVTDGIKKRHTKNANTPFILLGQKEPKLPKLSDLENWDVSKRQRRMRQTPDLIKTTLLTEPHIFGVIDNRP